jgi:hypothetical protein
MKRLLLTAVLLLTALPAQGQFRGGDSELMTMITAGTATTTEEVTVGESTGSSDRTDKFAYISINYGYYFVRRVSAELELGIRAEDGIRPLHTGIVNLSYTHLLPRSIIALYGRAGVGMSNGLTSPDHLALTGRMSEYDVTILQGGAGIKVRAGSRGLFRVELNYRHQGYTYEGPSATVDYSIGTLAVLIGMGLLL